VIDRVVGQAWPAAYAAAVLIEQDDATEAGVRGVVASSLPTLGVLPAASVRPARLQVGTARRRADPRHYSTSSGGSTTGPPSRALLRIS
jgi:hypothetical protein